MAKKSNTESISVRLDPKLKYLAELASRAERRTLSSFVEWAIDEAISKYTRRGSSESDSGHNGVYLDEDVLWDVDEIDRLVKLGIHNQKLLNYDEQVLFKIIISYDMFWTKGRTHFTRGTPNGPKPLYSVIRKNWNTIQKAAFGDGEEKKEAKEELELPMPF